MAGLTKCPDCGRVLKEDNRPGQHYVTYTAPCTECVNRKYQKRLDDQVAENRRREEAEKERKRREKEGWEKLEADRERRQFQEAVLDALGNSGGGGGAASAAAATSGCASIISGCTTITLTAFFFFFLACCCCGIGTPDKAEAGQEKTSHEQFHSPH